MAIWTRYVPFTFGSWSNTPSTIKDSVIAVTDSVFDSPAGSRKTSGAGIDTSNIKPGNFGMLMLNLKLFLNLCNITFQKK